MAAMNSLASAGAGAYGNRYDVLPIKTHASEFEISEKDQAAGIHIIPVPLRAQLRIQFRSFNLYCYTKSISIIYYNHDLSVYKNNKVACFISQYFATFVFNSEADAKAHHARMTHAIENAYGTDTNNQWRSGFHISQADCSSNEKAPSMKIRYIDCAEKQEDLVSAEQFLEKARDILKGNDPVLKNDGKLVPVVKST